jgi:phosphatidylserine synthase
MFIIDLTIADWMTLGGHLLVWVAFWCALANRVEFAIAALLVAMLVDALDGMVARKYNVARPFGRYLGSFVDLLNYTVVPPLVLWQLGMKGPEAQAVLWVYSTCGLLRLSRFNEVGNIQQEGKLAYLGLPVFWVHFVLMGLYVAWWFMDSTQFRIASSVSLLGLAFCFILDRPFWKPQNYTVIAIVTLACAAGFAAIGYLKL